MFAFYFILISVCAPMIGGYDIKTLDISMFLLLTIIYCKLFEVITRFCVVFLRLYIICCVCFSVFLFIQYFGFWFLNIKISGLIPFLGLYNEEIETISDISRLLRISSVFSEPSHFALYCFPAITVLLNNFIMFKKKYIYLVIIFSAIIISTSANGLVLALLSLFLYICGKYFIRLNIKHIIVGSLLIFVIGYAAYRSEFVSEITYGLFVQQEDQTQSKSDARIYRGFDFYYNLPLTEKIFGVGWREAESYCLANNQQMHAKYYIEAFDYFNSIAGILIYSGIIGFILFIAFIKDIWKYSTNKGYHALIITILISMISSSIFMVDQWLLYLSILFSVLHLITNKSKNNESNTHYPTNK